MKKWLLLLASLSLVASVVAAQKKSDESNLRSLVETERAFARTSVTDGMREAFLAYLADESVIFRPHAVNGKKWFMESASTPALLTWEPAVAEVSGAGDFGYTTGPWEYRQNGKDDEKVFYGNYVTVWKKQLDGKWKAVIDIGATNPQPAPAKTGPDPVKNARKPDAKAGTRVHVETERAALIGMDREFSKDAEANGFAAAFLSRAATDCLFFRPGAHPVKGRDAIRAALAASPGKLTWRTDGGGISESGDLGYTYGVSKFEASGKSGEPDESVYMRIWRKPRRGDWQVILDIANPAP
ncbi:MAG: DUF4440 domain-containing protein [Blastocatellia bacterium]|nr:DUF4440 domain-containing protein [Blastocatellia bacterium]